MVPWASSHRCAQHADSRGRVLPSALAVPRRPAPAMARELFLAPDQALRWGEAVCLCPPGLWLRGGQVWVGIAWRLAGGAWGGEGLNRAQWRRARPQSISWS